MIGRQLVSRDTDMSYLYVFYVVVMLSAGASEFFSEETLVFKHFM